VICALPPKMQYSANGNIIGLIPDGEDSATAAPGGAGIAKELILGGGQINAQRHMNRTGQQSAPAASLMEETKNSPRSWRLCLFCCKDGQIQY